MTSAFDLSPNDTAITRAVGGFYYALAQYCRQSDRLEFRDEEELTIVANKFYWQVFEPTSGMNIRMPHNSEDEIAAGIIDGGCQILITQQIVRLRNTLKPTTTVKKERQTELVDLTSDKDDSIEVEKSTTPPLKKGKAHAQPPKDNKTVGKSYGAQTSTTVNEDDDDDDKSDDEKTAFGTAIALEKVPMGGKPFPGGRGSHPKLCHAWVDTKHNDGKATTTGWVKKDNKFVYDVESECFNSSSIIRFLADSGLDLYDTKVLREYLSRKEVNNKHAFKLPREAAYKFARDCGFLVQFTPIYQKCASDDPLVCEMTCAACSKTLSVNNSSLLREHIRSKHISWSKDVGAHVQHCRHLGCGVFGDEGYKGRGSMVFHMKHCEYRAV